MTAGDLKKYKESCYSALSRDLTEFEKNFLLISGGILAFSTTFIKDVIKVPDIQFLPILFAAWILIIASIGFMMNAFLESATASDRLLNTIDAFEVTHELYKENIELNTSQWSEIKTTVSGILSTSKAKLKSRRNWAVRLFLAGIFLLSLFVAANLQHQKNVGEHATSQDKGQFNLKINQYRHE